MRILRQLNSSDSWDEESVGDPSAATEQEHRGFSASVTTERAH